MTPEQMVDWHNFRGEIIKELIENNINLSVENERLRKNLEWLRAAFRVNMLRAYPFMTHEEIDEKLNWEKNDEKND